MFEHVIMYVIRANCRVRWFRDCFAEFIHGKETVICFVIVGVEFKLVPLCEQSVGIKTIRVMLSGEVIGEGVAQGVGDIRYCGDFITIYREMVNACWRFLSWYFTNNIPDLSERGSTIYCRDKGLPRMSARGSGSFSAFGPLDSEMFHIFNCWRDFCSLLRFPSTTDSLFAVTVAPNCVNSAFTWFAFRNGVFSYRNEFFSKWVDRAVFNICNGQFFRACRREYAPVSFV